MQPTDELNNLMSPPIIAGVITWLITQALLIVVMIKLKPHKKDYRIEKAKRLGHEVIGVNNVKYDAENYRLREDERYRCEYVYSVNGENMIYRYSGRNLPPKTIKLYYVDNPNRVIPEESIPTWWRDMKGLFWGVIIYGAPLALGACVIIVLSNLQT
ncbi:MAG: hypothetical protein K5837_01340 [Candidatus Saccharibacteria bacterium]|nr:hypothetical protein [Candidatus Saccharibacteria bacterium]